MRSLRSGKTRMPRRSWGSTRPSIRWRPGRSPESWPVQRERSSHSPTVSLILTAINETLWSHFPKIHTIFFGAVIVLVVLFLPRGILHLFRARQTARVFLESLRAYRV